MNQAIVLFKSPRNVLYTAEVIICTMNTSRSIIDVMVKVLGVLECPVCFDYVKPPVQQCIEGHILCLTCKNKLRQCPTCEKAFTNIRIRSLDDISEAMLYPCNKEGCGTLLSLKERKSHEDNCTYPKLNQTTKEFTLQSKLLKNIEQIYPGFVCKENPTVISPPDKRATSSPSRSVKVNMDKCGSVERSSCNDNDESSSNYEEGSSCNDDDESSGHYTEGSSCNHNDESSSNYEEGSSINCNENSITNSDDNADASQNSEDSTGHCHEDIDYLSGDYDEDNDISCGEVRDIDLSSEDIDLDGDIDFNDVDVENEDIDLGDMEYNGDDIDLGDMEYNGDDIEDMDYNGVDIEDMDYNVDDIEDINYYDSDYSNSNDCSDFFGGQSDYYNGGYLDDDDDF